MRALLLALISVLIVFTWGCDLKKEPVENKPTAVSPITTASSAAPTIAEDVFKESELSNMDVNFTKESFPKIDGSTATIPLSQAIAEKLLGMSTAESEKLLDQPMLTVPIRQLAAWRENL